jgi:hypothetical protein
MIRIDEVYNNTFRPYVKKHVPLTRIFFCDPPGRSDPDSLFNFGDDVVESNYIFFHDQEPIHLDIHKQLFDDVARRNKDLNHGQGPTHSAIITSEWNSEFVDQVCSQYSWSHYYYFYHGWAALDWYRGYHRTWLMPDPEQRDIQKSFISPNRIIGGKRDHRVLLLYHLFKSNVSNAWISCPHTCPFENIPIDQIGSKFKNQYADIEQVFQSAQLPLNFANETDHPMHSCWLSLFDECAETLAYVVTETVFTGRRNHLTEKTFKPICQQMPFVLVSTAGSLRYLRQYGFKTFGDVWDESYDDELDDAIRLEKIAKLLHDLDSLSTSELQSLYQQAMPAIKHNYEHFYGGTFESLLWNEMTGMLEQIKNDF